jgi:hypothetical protein
MAFSTSPNQKKQDHEKALVLKSNIREIKKFGLERLDDNEINTRKMKNAFIEDNELRDLLKKEHEIDSADYLSTYSKNRYLIGESVKKPFKTFF